MPYTAGLLKSVPRLGARAAHSKLETIPGQVPMLTRLPPGCRFRPRCGYAVPACAAAEPPLSALPGGGEARCIRWSELDLSEGLPA
jgi:peptide/nickel transport system ATP-binding protein/oligopeptide transport system ATP-binding protein